MTTKACVEKGMGRLAPDGAATKGEAEWKCS